MTREESVSLLMEQTWVEDVYTLRLMQVRRNSHVYLHLKEAFDVLKMGYDGDFQGIKDRDREGLTNINVWFNQFKRAGIDINQLKVVKLLD
jgi:hypothetical protein